ncbi:MAG TPA: metallophosphoesterase [Thermoanaerobaculia bacterium]|nr:metallophosphoesterase [Thermoanaerobaculia bacterium]
MRLRSFFTRGRLAALGVVASLGVADACWLEPYRLLVREEVRLPLAASPLSVIHLSDLHIASESIVERRLLRRVAAEQPDLILLSGDLISDSKSGTKVMAHTRAALAVLRELAAIAPLYAVQGHSEYHGWVVAQLGASGLTWLSNEGRLVGGAQPVLLLGLNQQVGRDELVSEPEPPLAPLTVDGRGAYGRALSGKPNHYSHYDPDPASLTDEPAPYAWSGYEVSCELRFADRDSEGALTLHSRYPLGEDRMLTFGRSSPDDGSSSSFLLFGHGTGMSEGSFDTGIEPEPGRWYRLRVRTRTSPEAVRVEARVWAAGEPEPEGWQAWGVDRTPERLPAGTVGFWAREGAVAYRDLRVTAADGTVLLADPLAGPEPPRGFRNGPRGTRLELALARSPAVPAGTPTLVLTHVPDPILEAAERGIDAMLAGHTHGGQVRMPGFALVTRTPLGRSFDRGVFDLPRANPRGSTRLYINSGVGMSWLPIRFLCPPKYAVVKIGI